MHPTQAQILLALLDEPRSGPQIAWEIARMIKPSNPKEGKPADSLIYKHLETLMKQELVTKKAETDKEGKTRNVYSVRFGCFGGTAVLKTKDNTILLISCPYVVKCRCDIISNNKRKIEPKCRYYRYIYSNEPIVKIKL